MAGPNERAGLTDVPVTGIATRWINSSVKPIASPAIVLLPTLEVVANITNRKRNVNTASIRKAEAVPYSF